MPSDWIMTTLGDPEFFHPIGTGVQPFDGFKDYLSTSSVNGTKILYVEQEVTYRRRPSRANLQPVPNAAWFARMRDTQKVLESDHYLCQQAILSTGFCGLGSDKVASSFLKQYLLSAAFERQKNRLAEGTTQAALTNGKLCHISIRFPEDLQEQRIIAQVLSTVDRAIEQTAALIAKQQRIKTGLMQDLLTRGIDEHGNLRSEATHKFKDSPIGRIPVEWEVGQLGAYIHLQGGFAFSSKDSCELGARWLKIANVGVDAISWDAEDFLPSRHLKVFCDYVLEHGDVVIALTRPVIRHELKVAQLTRVDVPCLLNQRVARVVPCDGTNLEFLLSVIKSRFCVAQIEDVILGTDPPNISTGELEGLAMPLIDEAEQARIGRYLAPQRLLSEQYVQCLAKAIRLKNALVQALLTGKRRVKALLNQEDGVTE